MYKVSVWASRHIWLSRFVFACIKLLSWLLAIYIGISFDMEGMQLPLYPCSLIAGLLVVMAIIIYPITKNKIEKRRLYFKRKLGDFLLPLATGLIIASSINQNEILHAYPDAAAVCPGPSNSTTDASFAFTEKKGLKSFFIKLFAKPLAKQLQKTNEKTIWKVLKTVLSVVVFLVLAYLLALLACNISCSGAEALAIVVLLGGLTGLVFGFIGIMKWIWRGKKQKKENPATVEPIE